MAAHKFAVGVRVRVSLDTTASHNPMDVYTISCTLPAQGNVWQYRVKREGDGQERAVNESQLVMVSQQLTDRTQFEAQRNLQRERNARARTAAKRVSGQ